MTDKVPIGIRFFEKNVMITVVADGVCTEDSGREVEYEIATSGRQTIIWFKEPYNKKVTFDVDDMVQEAYKKIISEVTNER
jgi:hypothetical protein